MKGGGIVSWEKGVASCGNRMAEAKEAESDAKVYESK